jgi:hypothetical protein
MSKPSEYQRSADASDNGEATAGPNLSSAEPHPEDVPEAANASDSGTDVTGAGGAGAGAAFDADADDEPVDQPFIWSTADPGEQTVNLSAAGDITGHAAGAGSTGTATPRRPGLLRPRNLVLVGLSVVTLTLAIIFGPIAWDVWHEKDVRIATPPKIAGLTLDDSQGAHDTIDYLRTAIETGVSLKKTTGAVYADEAGESRSVLFVGGIGVLVSPDEALTKTFALITDDSGGVEGVHEVAAGALGGTMKCGSTRTDGGSMAVCGWADHGSLGIAMFPNRPVDQSAELLRSIRKAVQNRH